jgi:hypothetical protein
VSLNLRATITLGRVLIPLALIAPSTKALVAGVVPCEMAMLYKPLLLVATRNEGDFFVVAHFGCDVQVKLSTASAKLSCSRH